MNTRINSTENLSSRAQELLTTYTAKKKNALSDGSKAVSYDDVLKKLTLESHARMERLKNGSAGTTARTAAAETPAASAAETAANSGDVKSFRWNPAIRSNAETRVYLGPIDGLAGEKKAEAQKPAEYQKTINELAVRYRIDEKLKNRNVGAEIQKLAENRLYKNEGKTLMVRSDLPTVTETYTVKRGDTLAGIAKKYYDDAFMFKNVAIANDQKAPYKLQEGQNIRIIFHKVTAGEGDTMATISEKFTGGKVPAGKLEKINQKSQLAAGETVLIPLQFTELTKAQADAAATQTDRAVAAAETAATDAKMPATAAAAARSAAAPEKAVEENDARLNKNDRASIENVKKQIEKYSIEIDTI